MNPTEDLQSPPYLSPSLIPIFQIQLPHGTVQHSFKNAIGQFKGIIQPLLLRQLPRAQHALTIDSVLQRLQGGGIIMRIGHADWTRGLDTRRHYARLTAKSIRVHRSAPAAATELVLFKAPPRQQQRHPQCSLRAQPAAARCHAGAEHPHPSADSILPLRPKFEVNQIPSPLSVPVLLENLSASMPSF